MNKKAIFTSKTYFFILAGLFLAQQLTILVRFAKNVTNLDQTLLWYAAKEFLHLRLHEPNFYGQTYNTIYEAVPGQVLHHTVGLSLAVAVPLGTMIIVSLIWLLLAVVAYKNNRPNLALLALAIPTILRLQYLVLFDAPRGILAGDLLSIVAVALAFWVVKDVVLRLGSLILLGGLAIAWDFDTAFIILPAVTYLVFQNGKQLLSQPKRLMLLAAAAAPPVAWILFDHYWYSRHPYDLTNQSVSIKPVWGVFVQNLHHFSSYFAYFAPAVLPIAAVGAVVVCVTLLAVLAVSIRIKSRPLFASSLVLIIITFLALSLLRSMNTVNTSPGLLLSASRLFILMPIALYFLIFLASLSLEKAQVPLLARLKRMNLQKYLGLFLVVLAVVSFSVSEMRFSSIVNRAVAQNTSGGLLGEVSMLAPCRTIYEDYVANKAQLVATTNPVIAYGCAAQYNKLNTFDTPADRRGWIIRYNYEVPSSRMLVEGNSCVKAIEIGAKCSPARNSFLFVETSPHPAASTLSKLGLPVRQYDSSGYR